MLEPIHQARHDVCMACPFWNAEQSRCQDVTENPTPYGSDAHKVSLAPWKFRVDGCEIWDEQINEEEIAHDAAEPEQARL